jgi:hypothetical protein
MDIFEPRVAGTSADPGLSRDQLERALELFSDRPEQRGELLGGAAAGSSARGELRQDLCAIDELPSFRFADGCEERRFFRRPKLEGFRVLAREDRYGRPLLERWALHDDFPSDDLTGGDAHATKATSFAVERRASDGCIQGDDALGSGRSRSPNRRTGAFRARTIAYRRSS